MKNLWDEKAFKRCGKDPVKQRVLTSRLLGANPDLVMHGGGNTSVKATKKNFFGEKEDLLFVKGSGWDLATIEPQGFAPVKMDTLLKMAELDELSDLDMVKYQRAAMTDPSAPNPSVEAILHAIIPFKFVDHTHADGVVTLTNTKQGKQLIQEIYGDRILIIPYVMPGFILAKKIYQMTKNLDWSTIDGMILLNHGVFTFADTAKESYDKMIGICGKAEDYLKKQCSEKLKASKSKVDLLKVAAVRKKVSATFGKAVLAPVDLSAVSSGFSNLDKVSSISNRGPITPDHIIRTKRAPAVIGKDVDQSIDKFVSDYKDYYKANASSGQKMLDPAPRWAILPKVGSMFFGTTLKATRILADIAEHTQKSIHQAEQLGGWKPLSKKHLFEMEYWSLEQAKLGKGGKAPELQGKVAIVTGAASGIGRACVKELVARGAVVGALDIDKKLASIFEEPEVLPLVCDITNDQQIVKSIEQVVTAFGGIDLVLSNAGIFPASAQIEDMNGAVWNKSLDINLTSHQKLLQYTTPYLELGIDPAVVLMGSKNVPAPGPGASAYSVAKAGLAQLGRVAALELGSKGIRVNTIHPNAVYDTGIWTDEVLKARAKHYGLSVTAYKTNNVLRQEITSKDVAQLAISMMGGTFSKVTGAQIPIDGGNERVI